MNFVVNWTQEKEFIMSRLERDTDAALFIATRKGHFVNYTDGMAKIVDENDVPVNYQTLSASDVDLVALAEEFGCGLIASSSEEIPSSIVVSEAYDYKTWTNDWGYTCFNVCPKRDVVEALLAKGDKAAVLNYLDKTDAFV